jgi:hypothetical protein
LSAGDNRNIYNKNWGNVYGDLRPTQKGERKINSSKQREKYPPMTTSAEVRYTYYTEFAYCCRCDHKIKPLMKRT